MSQNPTGICAVMPSRLGVGEAFALKVKVLGPMRPVRWNCFAWRMEGRVVVRNGDTAARLTPESDPRILETRVPLTPLTPGEFCYVRLVTKTDDMAWSSPRYGG